MRSITTLIVCALALIGCGIGQTDSGETTSDAATEVRAMLGQQIADWNKGDIDAFMGSYWADPEVRFASGGDLKRGWQRVMDQYKARYPDRSAMGELSTVELEVTPLAVDAAMAFGRYIVSANDEVYCGLFTLILRKFDGRWVVVHDHTSAANGPMADGRTCRDIKIAATKKGGAK